MTSKIAGFEWILETPKIRQRYMPELQIWIFGPTHARKSIFAEKIFPESKI